MAIVIKKRVTLEFLGEEYKDSFLEFKAISVGELDEYIKKTQEIEKEGNTGSVKFILDVLKKKFVSGSIQGEEVKAEDLDDLDIETTIKSFRRLSGQEITENLAKP